MKEIHFTQFLRPDGERRSIVIDRSDEVGDKAALILAAGYVFECEVQTGEVSLTISDGTGDHAMELVPNGPAVAPAVDRLILGFTIPYTRRQQCPARRAVT